MLNVHAICMANYFLFVFAFLCHYVTDVGTHILWHFCCLTFVEYIIRAVL